MDSGASLGQARADIIITADKAIAALKQFGSAADQTMQSVGQSGTKAASGFASFEQTLRSPNVQAAGGALSAVGAAVGLIGGFAINSAMQFDQGMANVRAATGATGVEFDSLRNLALQIGKDTSFSANEATLAIEELAKAGVSTTDILGGAAEATTALAAAGGVALPEAATVMAASMNQFGLAAGDASGYYDEFGNSVNNASHIADVLAGAALASSTGVSEMGASLSYVGTSAAALGVPIEDTTTALALMAKQNIIGSAAGTSLNQVLLSLANPTDQAAGVMQELGLSFTDLNGNMLPLPDIIGSVATATEGMGNATRQAYLEQLFGVEGGKAMNALLISQDDALAGTTGSWDGMYAAVTDVGIAQEQADARLNSTSGRLDALKGTIETVGIVIGSKLLPVFDAIILGATSLLNAFLELPSGAQAVIAAVVGIAGAVAGLTGAFILVGPKIIDAVKGFRDLTGIGKSAASGIEAVGNSAGKSASGMNTANTAGKGLRATMLGVLGPIALVVAAGAALYFAYKTNFLGFADGVNAVAGKLKDVFSGIKDAVLGLLDPIIKPFKTLKKVFDDLTRPVNDATATLTRLGLPITSVSTKVNRFTAFITALRTAFPALNGPINAVISVFNALKGIFDSIVGTIQTVVDRFQMFSQTMGVVDSAVRALISVFPSLGGVISAVGDMVRAVIDVFTGLYNAIASAFSGDWEGVVAGLKQAISGVWDFVKAQFGLWKEIGQLVVDAFNAIPWGVVGSALVASFQAAWSAVKAGASNLWDWLTSSFGSIDWSGLVSGAVSMLGDAGSALLSWGMDFIQGLWTGAQTKWDEFTGWLGGLATGFGDWLGDLGGPVGTVVTAISTSIDTAWTLISASWDVIKGWATGIADALGIPSFSSFLSPISLLGNSISMAWELISTAWDAVKTWATNLVSDLGAGDFSAFTAPISAIADAITGAWNLISPAWDTIKGWATGITDALGIPSFSSFLSPISLIGNSITMAWELISPAWDALKSWAANIVADVGVPAFDAFTGAIDAIATGIGAAWTLIQAAWTPVAAFVTNVASGLSLPDFSTLTAVWATISTGIDTAWGLIQTAWTTVAGFISNVAGGLSLPDFSSLNAVWATISTGIDTAWGLIEPAWASISGWISGLSGSATAPDFTPVTDPIAGIATCIDTAWTAISTAWTVVAGFITNVASGLSIPDFATLCAAFQTIGDGIDTAWGLIETAWDQITGWADGITLTVPSFSAFLRPISLIGNSISMAWEVISPAWDVFTSWASTIVSSLSVPDFSAFIAPFQTFSDGIFKIVDFVTGKLGEFVTFLSNIKIPDIKVPDLSWLPFVDGPTKKPESTGTVLGPPAPAGPTAADAVAAIALAQSITDAATRARTAMQQIITDAYNMRTEVTTTFGGVVTDVGAAMSGFNAGAAALFRVAVQQMMTDSTNAKIGIVQNITDTVTTSATLMGSFFASVPAIFRAGVQQMMIDASNAKIGVVTDVTDMVVTTLTLMTGWSASLTPIATAIDLAVRLPFSTMKIGVVTDVTDMVITTLTLLTGWSTSVLPIATAIDVGMRLPMSTMKIGVVTDVGDMVMTTLTLLTGWSASITPIAVGVDAAVRAAVSTMKIGAVADIRDLVSSSIAQFGAWSTALKSNASLTDAAVRRSISAMKIGGVADLTDLNTSGSAQARGLNTSVSGAMNAMRSVGSAAARGLQSEGIAAIRGMVGPMGSAAGEAVSAVVGRLRGGAGDVRGAGATLGSAATEGVAAGIRGNLGAVTSAVNAIVREVDRALAAGLRVASPSKLTGWYGRMSIEGFAGDIIKGLPQVANAIGRVVQTVKDSMTGTATPIAVTVAASAVSNQQAIAAALAAYERAAGNTRAALQAQVNVRDSHLTATQRALMAQADALQNKYERSDESNTGPLADQIRQLAEQLNRTGLHASIYEDGSIGLQEAKAWAGEYTAAVKQATGKTFMETLFAGIDAGKALQAVTGIKDTLQALATAKEIVATRVGPASPPVALMPSMFTLPVGVSPLPPRASSGLGGGITINWNGDISVTGNGSLSYDAGQLRNAVNDELPALVTAIRRDLGGS